MPGYGFLLNNELTDFDTGSVDRAEPPEASKRPRSSIAPTIVTKDDQPFFTIGSPGGASIITTVLQTLVNRINLAHAAAEVGSPRRARASATAPTTEAESAFVSSPEGKQLLTITGSATARPRVTRSAR